ncbi:VOC family protein [Kineococcus sp. SYSU DK002]|uniref:VOC family protein n=1 Tax=Kineococcus sp. SYSU DK002 TaxID=3383123 RepID=UPI003D7F0170
MTAPLGAVVLSTPDPRRLAAFYAALLGWSVVSSDPDRVRLRSPQEERPGLSFQREPGDTPPTWPAREGGVAMQAHLDVLVDDLDAEQARAVSLGAGVETHQPAPGVRVMRDPHGHLFCLFLPGA